MAIPLLQKARIGAYIMRQQIAGRKRYPLVLMLEPLFRCNLACAGCGKIDYPTDILDRRLSVDDTRSVIAALERRFTNIVGPDIHDICYATQNRQSAVRELARVADVILVVGARNSSNSNRLREIGIESGVPSYLIADGNELDPAWLAGAEVIGVTAGASAPEVLVEHVIDALRRYGPVSVSVLPGRQETVEFRLPAELADTTTKMSRSG
jgi:4-hydroxy-3-methylbut-2-enyl diphosphate reductase